MRKLLFSTWMPKLLAVFALVAVAAPASAMTVLQVDLKALITTADQVLYGTIAGTKVIDRRKEGRGVWTEISLDVKEVWKGDARLASKRFSWLHVGGTTPDGITVAVPGMPGFVAGEETVVVLEKNTESYVISGGPQGKFNVKLNSVGQKTVTRDMPDVNFIRQDPQSGKMQQAPRQVQIVRTLNEFRAEVLGYVADALKATKPAKAPATGK